MSKIGYIRVSTEHQETARQQEIMCSYQVDRIFSEKLSGANTDRPQLRAMLDYVREGDTLYIESISRLGRSTKDLLNIIDTLTDKGVTLIRHKENIDTDTPTGKFMLTVFAALSQLEREQLKQRQREGIEIAKAQGKYTGRKPLPTDWTRFGQLYGEWKSKNITGRDFMLRMDMSANTFYRRRNRVEYIRRSFCIQKFHRKLSAGCLNHRGIVQKMLYFLCCKRSGHHQNMQIGIQIFPHIPYKSQTQIAIAIPLVEFVKDNRADLFQQGILLNFTEHDPFGHDKEPCSF
jgi:DNA invertase Pin-like site-specific DNA recombinase